MLECCVIASYPTPTADNDEAKFPSRGMSGFRHEWVCFEDRCVHWLLTLTSMFVVALRSSIDRLTGYEARCRWRVRLVLTTQVLTSQEISQGT